MNLGRILLRQSGLPLRLTYGCRLHRVRCLLLWEREIMGEGRRWNRFGFHCSSVGDGLSPEPHHGSTKTVVHSASPPASLGRATCGERGSQVVSGLVGSVKYKNK